MSLRKLLSSGRGITHWQVRTFKCLEVANISTNMKYRPAHSVHECCTACSQVKRAQGEIPEPPSVGKEAQGFVLISFAITGSHRSAGTLPVSCYPPAYLLTCGCIIGACKVQRPIKQPPNW